MKKLTLCTLFLLAACTSGHYTSTDTYADYQAIPGGFPRGSTFTVASLEQGNEILAKSIAHKIETILQAKGYAIASAGSADYDLRFSLQMSRSVTKETVAKRVPPKTESKKGFVRRDDDSVHFEEKIEFSSDTLYEKEEKVEYEKELKVIVYQGKNQVWSGSSLNVDRRDDIREPLDHLLSSVFRYFGIDTRKKIGSFISDEELQKFSL